MNIYSALMLVLGDAILQHSVYLAQLNSTNCALLLSAPERRIDSAFYSLALRTFNEKILTNYNLNANAPTECTFSNTILKFVLFP
jgi:hypothetical protein